MVSLALMAELWGPSDRVIDRGRRGDSPWAAAYRPSISVLTSDLGSVGAFMAEALLHDLGVTGAAPDWEVEPDRFVPKGSLWPAPSA